MSRTKLGFIITCAALVVNLVMSMILVFAKNVSYPKATSTGWNVLIFKSDFFTSGFEVIGAVASVIFVLYLLASAGAIGSGITGFLSKDSQAIAKPLRSVTIGVYAGFVMVVLAVITLLISSAIMTYDTYTTQYYWLLIPLVVALGGVMLIRREAKRPKDADQA